MDCEAQDIDELVRLSFMHAFVEYCLISYLNIVHSVSSASIFFFIDFALLYQLVVCVGHPTQLVHCLWARNK